MAEFFATGHVVVGILALMLLELVVLMILGSKSHRRIPLVHLLVALGAGAALLLALRAALLGSPWQYVAVWLLVALCVHVLDVRLRWTVKNSEG